MVDAEHLGVVMYMVLLEEVIMWSVLLVFKFDSNILPSNRRKEIG